MEPPPIDDIRDTLRTRAYLDLLRWGLLMVRDEAHRGRLRVVEIEANHLHNIPTLIGEENELRHRYFIEKERSLYLERIREATSPEEISFRLGRYAGPWTLLAAVAGIEISE